MRTEGVKEFYLFYMAADNVQIGWNNTQQQQNLALLRGYKVVWLRYCGVQ